MALYFNDLQVYKSIEAVKLWQFVAATCFVSPKLALHVFIGSKIATLSDGDQRSHMDTRTVASLFPLKLIVSFLLLGTKVINGLLIVGGIIIAIFTSWYVALYVPYFHSYLSVGWCTL